MATKRSGSRNACELLKLTYAYSTYAIDGSTYITAFMDDELYGDVTINLGVYGITPAKNQVVLPTYKFSKAFERTVKHDLVKKVVKRIDYGPYDAYGELVELKDDWQDRALSYDALYE